MDERDITRRVVAELLDQAARLWASTIADDNDGYFDVEGDEGFVCLAARAYYRHEDRRSTDDPVLPGWQPAKGTHVVYAAYDVHGRVLYIGVTSHFAQRMRAHESRSPWWPFARRIVIEGDADTRRAAEMYERDLILMCMPPFNRTGVPV